VQTWNGLGALGHRGSTFLPSPSEPSRTAMTCTRMRIFSTERVKMEVCLRSRRDRRRRCRKSKESLTKNVEGETTGAATLVAAARPGMQPARVAVRAPVVSPPRRQVLCRGSGRRDGAVLGAAVERVDGVGAVRVNPLPLPLSSGHLVLRRRPRAPPRPAKLRRLLDALPRLIRVVGGRNLAFLHVAVRGPVLRRVARPRRRRRGRLGRRSRGRDGAVLSAGVEAVGGVGAVRVHRPLLLRAVGGDNPRPAVPVPGPVLRRAGTRRGRLGGGPGSRDGAVLGAAVEGVGGVWAVRVDTLRLEPSSGVHRRRPRALFPPGSSSSSSSSSGSAAGTASKPDQRTRESLRLTRELARIRRDSCTRRGRRCRATHGTERKKERKMDGWVARVGGGEIGTGGPRWCLLEN
jgi:hypothetical protein